MELVSGPATANLLVALRANDMAGGSCVKKPAWPSDRRASQRETRLRTAVPDDTGWRWWKDRRGWSRLWWFALDASPGVHWLHFMSGPCFSHLATAPPAASLNIIVLGRRLSYSLPHSAAALAGVGIQPSEWKCCRSRRCSPTMQCPRAANAPATCISNESVWPRRVSGIWPSCLRRKIGVKHPHSGSLPMA